MLKMNMAGHHCIVLHKKDMQQLLVRSLKRVSFKELFFPKIEQPLRNSSLIFFSEVESIDWFKSKQPIFIFDEVEN